MKNQFYLNLLNHIKNKDNDIKTKILSSKYFENIINANGRLEKSLKEIDYIVNVLLNLDNPIGKDFSLELLKLGIKSYHIMWITLSDVLIDFINKVYNLGILTKDATYSIVLSNEKLAKSEVLNIFKKYKSELNIEEYRQIRNLIVHQNVFADPMIKDLENEIELKIAKHVSIKTYEDMLAESFKDLTDDLSELFKNRYSAICLKMNQHLEKSRTMINELLVILFKESEKVLLKIELDSFD